MTNVTDENHQYGPLKYQAGVWSLGDTARRHVSFDASQVIHIQPGSPDTFYSWSSYHHMELRLAKSRIPTQPLRDYILPIFFNAFAFGEFSEQSYSYLEIFTSLNATETLVIDNDGVSGYFYPVARRVEKFFHTLSVSSEQRELLMHPYEIFDALER